MQIITTIRSLFDFTQKELAEYLDVTQGFIAQLENGIKFVPRKSSEALDELTSRIPEMEAIDGAGFTDFYPEDGQAEINDWILRLHHAEKALRKIDVDIQKFDTKRACHMRLIAYSSTLPAEPAESWDFRRKWWDLMIARLKQRTGKLKTGIRQRLVVRKAILEAEIAKSKEMLAYWTQLKEGKRNS